MTDREEEISQVQAMIDTLLDNYALALAQPDSADRQAFLNAAVRVLADLRAKLARLDADDR